MTSVEQNTSASGETLDRSNGTSSTHIAKNTSATHNADTHIYAATTPDAAGSGTTANTGSGSYAATSTSSRGEERFDLGALFPGKGDPRRPPEWFGRGLLYTAIAVMAYVFITGAWARIADIVFYVVISLFIALAVEPIVRFLVGHGWKRGAASGVSLLGLLVAIIGLLVLFGSMFVQQLTGMVRAVPSMYNQIVNFIEEHTSWRAPSIESLGMEFVNSLRTDTITNFADQALSTTASFFSALLGVMTVMLVTYYISAALPAMRRSMCQWVAPRSQERFLLVWTVVQDQISNFLYSRIILAVISSVCMSLFLIYLHVPYWLPLSIFCGLVSQFVPTVGTYIGGALPVLSALGTNGLLNAVFVLVYIVVYQQIENLLLSPAISKHTMDLNPAIAFLSVLVLGSIFGALGAFLALPITASFQAIFKAYTRRYELIDSPLLTDPQPRKKSRMVQSVENISEHVNRVAERLPRAAKGSSKRVHYDQAHVDSELVYVHEQLDQLSTQREQAAAHDRAQHEAEQGNDGSEYTASALSQQELDESATVAISRAAVKQNLSPAHSKHGDNVVSDQRTGQTRVSSKDSVNSQNSATSQSDTNGQADNSMPEYPADHEDKPLPPALGRGARGEWK